MIFNKKLDSIVSDFTKIVNKLDKFIQVKMDEKSVQYKLIDEANILIGKRRLDVKEAEVDITRATTIKANVSKLLNI